jgi:hypothetical protein
MLVPLVFFLMAAVDKTPPPPAPTPADPAAIDQAALHQLLAVRRVFVDRFSGGETAAQMRDMILAGLQNTKLFVITENADRADATLRGSGEDLVFTEEHSTNDSIHANANFATGSSSSYSGRTSGRDTTDRSNGIGVGDSEQSHSVERQHEAVAAVRLVDKDGDVIWSTTQESRGGKFHGSSADVADKITKKLLEDYDRARKLK